jgi:hypothetical protein
VIENKNLTCNPKRVTILKIVIRGKNLKEFIEKILHQNIELVSYEKPEQLPLMLKSNYELYDMEISGQHCLLARPTKDIGLVELRKQQKRLELLTGMYCVLYLTRLNPYSREKMLEEGIPFVLENSQVYMPFLGVLLSTNETRTIKPCSRVSFLTQKLLLLALYEGWENATVTMAAGHLNVSKMSITRCFDEIESLEIPVLAKKGHIRYICCKENKKSQREILKPFMRSPVIQEFYLEEDISANLIKSGISALSEFSMLEDNSYPTCAITKVQMKEYGIRERKQVPKGEVPGCVVQELGYLIPCNAGKVIDPLTTLLIMETGREDPRVDKALDEMLEGVCYGGMYVFP